MISRPVFFALWFIYCRLTFRIAQHGTGEMAIKINIPCMPSLWLLH